MRLKVIRYEGPRGHVAVRESLQGKHEQYSLCSDCELFSGSPTPTGHCPIARELMDTARRHDLLTVIWECGEFEPKRQLTAGQHADSD